MQGWGRSRLIAASTLAVTCAAAFGTLTASGFDPGIPFSQKPVRDPEPVVLTGSQFPTWSAGPEFTLHEPMSPLNSSTVGQQGSEPSLLQSNCYDPQGVTYGGGGYTDNGDHNCYQSSRLPVRTNPLLKGVDPRRILGFRWDTNGHKFVQVPFQVVQVFTRYITNNASGFAFYSGVDGDTDYAFDREGFRFTANRPPAAGTAPTNDVCWSIPLQDPHGGFYDGQATTPSPNGFHLVDKDELSFMARDAGAAAPANAKLPAGIADAYTVTVRDAVNRTTGYVYVALSGPQGPAPAFTAQNSPYVHYQPDSDARMFVYSQSSYSGYGAAPKGYYCNADHTLAVDSSGNPLIKQRRPKDTAWVFTPRYAFRYDGRWLMTEIHVSDHDNGFVSSDGQLHNYGPNIVDRWKARAFQQSPGGSTPCCGYEEEATNWGGSSILMGERTGPVRVIRATWGADSSTNNIRREIFYADEVRYQDDLRVHVIPPLDGIYVQRDMRAGMIDTYYNPYQKAGVAIDGRNDQLIGNTHDGVGGQGVCYSSQDGLGNLIKSLTGKSTINVSPTGTDACNNNDIHGDFAVTDPTFSGPPGLLPWEELTGPSGTLVERWTSRVTTAVVGTAAAAVASHPYFRDDACFDDGTGTDPGPKIDLRSSNEPKWWWLDPATNVPVSNDHPPAGVVLNARRCWNHKPDGTPYPAGQTDPPPNPAFSPQGDVRYFQGDIGTHGLHVLFIVDSDNAQMTVPVDELDSEQTQVILPGRQKNVGEAYGRAFEEPLLVTAVPSHIAVENLAVSAHQAPSSGSTGSSAEPIAANRPIDPVPFAALGASVLVATGAAAWALRGFRLRLV